MMPMIIINTAHRYTEIEISTNWFSVLQGRLQGRTVDDRKQFKANSNFHGGREGKGSSGNDK
jgi:hypothetical protein